MVGELPDFAAPPRTAGRGAGRRPDRPERRAAGRPRLRPHARPAGGWSRGRASTSAGRRSSWPRPRRPPRRRRGLDRPVQGAGRRVRGRWPPASSAPAATGPSSTPVPAATSPSPSPRGSPRTSPPSPRGCPAPRSSSSSTSRRSRPCCRAACPPSAASASWRPSRRTSSSRSSPPWSPRCPVPVVLHCCAPRPPLDLFRAAGAAALSFDLGLVQDLDAVGTRDRGRRPPAPRRRPRHRRGPARRQGDGVPGAGLVARARLPRRPARRPPSP